MSKTQSSNRGHTQPSRSPVAAVLASCKSAFFALFLASGVINLLTLTGSLYMMQVYDRVLGSQSVPTLVGLSVLAIAAFAFQGVLEGLRARVLTLIGERVEAEVGPRVHAAVAEMPLRHANPDGLGAFRHLEALRGFLAGPGPLALYDLPWMPIYLLAIFLLHPWLGGLVIAGAGIAVTLTIISEVRGREPARTALQAQAARNIMADDTVRAADAVRAMGFLPQLARRWAAEHARYCVAQRRSALLTGGLTTLARTFRIMLQSAVLGLGAYLAIRGQMSAGAIIAASILSSRALAPVDQAIGAWRSFIAARHGYGRLLGLLAQFPERADAFELPAPTRSLDVDTLSVAAPGSTRPIVRRIKFRLEAGQALGIIGPSASGKSSLARGLVNVWPLLGGEVKLDDASIGQWTPAKLGRSIGYLPQDAQLLDGTIAENIARFDADVVADGVIAAAEVAGLHAHVKKIGGYDVRIGQGGAHLSAGQRQRVGLARALYGRPFLVVLDEPNSNLDQDGEAAVVNAIQAVKAWGGIAIVVAHRPSAIAAVDMLLVLHEGEAAAFGPKAEVMRKFVQNANQIIGAPHMRLDGPPRAIESRSSDSKSGDNKKDGA